LPALGAAIGSQSEHLSNSVWLINMEIGCTIHQRDVAVIEFLANQWVCDRRIAVCQYVGLYRVVAVLCSGKPNNY